MPTWRLVHPNVTERWQVHRKLVTTRIVESHIAGSDAGLEAYAEGEEIPEDVQYLWIGGHVNTTEDEAIRDLWVANGFTYSTVSGGGLDGSSSGLYPGGSTFPGNSVYPEAA